MLQTSASGLKYFADIRNGRPDGKMSHLACFTGTELIMRKNVEGAIFSRVVLAN